MAVICKRRTLYKMALVFWSWIVLDVTIFRPRSRWSRANGYSMTVWNAENGPVYEVGKIKGVDLCPAEL